MAAGLAGLAETLRRALGPAAADRVIVLEHGSIVEAGPHAELVEAGGRYARLWAAWESRTPASADTASGH